MVKKLKTLAKADDKQLASAVRTSAQQIWQAGLGAFAKAQEEGGKVFAKLVEEGAALQKRTQKLADVKVADVAGTVTEVADGVSRQAAGSWDKLEQVFEERVARSLSRIGVPTQNEMAQLTARVDQLSKAVAALSGKGGAKPAARGVKAEAEAKPAVRRAVKKPAAKAAKPAAKKTSAKAATKPAAKRTVPKVEPAEAA